MKKYLTAASHAVVAVAGQAALAPLIGPVGGGVAMVAFYASREYTQHEYKLAIQRGWQWGDRLSATVKPWEPLYRGWSIDSALDLAAPVAACTAFVALI